MEISIRVNICPTRTVYIKQFRLSSLPRRYQNIKLSLRCLMTWEMLHPLYYPFHWLSSPAPSSLKGVVVLGDKAVITHVPFICGTLSSTEKLMILLNITFSWIHRWVLTITRGPIRVICYKVMTLKGRHFEKVYLLLECKHPDLINIHVSQMSL